MEIHEAFTKWAVEKGVKINGLAAHKFEGRGLGIIAEKRHEVCREIEYLLSCACHSITLLSTIVLEFILCYNPFERNWIQPQQATAYFHSLDSSLCCSQFLRLFLDLKPISSLVVMFFEPRINLTFSVKLSLCSCAGPVLDLKIKLKCNQESEV